MRAITSLAVIGYVAATVGCGGGDRSGEFHVEGKVSFNGEPLPAGMVLLSPDVQAGNDGLQGYAKVSNGRFDTSLSGKGVTGGDYVLQIHGFDRPAEGQPSRPPKCLFHSYTVKLNLEHDGGEYSVDVSTSAGSVEGIEIAPPT